MKDTKTTLAAIDDISTLVAQLAIDLDVAIAVIMPLVGELAVKKVMATKSAKPA